MTVRVLGIVLLGALLQCAGAQAAGPAAVDTARLGKAAAEPGQWLTVGRTSDEQRFSPLKQINAENVGQLSLAWYVDFDSNRGHTYLGDPSARHEIYPDYPQIFKGFGITCERVEHKKDLDAALQRLIDAPGAYALDVMVPYTEHVLPMIPANKTFNDIITD